AIQQALALLESLAHDTYPSVRLAVATACRQLVSGSLTVDTEPLAELPVGAVLSVLVESSSDAKDPLFPYMIWMAGEPSFAKHPKGGLDWLAEHGQKTMPLSGILLRKAMRR